MRIDTAQRKHLRNLLSRRQESAGVVTRRANGLHFDETRALRRDLKTFHTHNLSDKSGGRGFDPPSRKDMSYLMKFSKKGHYVVSHRGIYYVKIDCRVSVSASKKLITAMSEMQRTMKPGARYNARYLSDVNSIAPRCLKVTFTTWSSLT